MFVAANAFVWLTLGASPVGATELREFMRKEFRADLLAYMRTVLAREGGK